VYHKHPKEIPPLNDPEPGTERAEPAPPVDARASIAMRAAYFFQFGGIGAYSPYLTLYYRSLGLSGTDIGTLAAIQPLATAILAPSWGLVADRWGVHRIILRAGLIGGALIALLLLGATSFWQFLPLIALLAFFVSPTASLIDSYGVTISERRGVSFGAIRIWGSIGYIVATWVGGSLMGGTVSRWFLLAYATTLILACVSTLGLPVLKLRAAKQVWSGAATVVRQPAMIVLLLTFFLMSCATTPSYAFFGIYLTELGGTTALLGTASALSAVSELPIMVFGGWLLQRLGARPMLALALVVYTLRFALYSVLPVADWVLGIQLLHGLTFGLYLMSSITLMHQTLGKQFAATAQGLLSSTYAFGQITGALVGGALLDTVSVFVIFRIAAGVMFLALVVLLVGTRLAGTHIDQSAVAADAHGD
jgi:MFS transporter, PPP family, 3-phenylpropionic acid transporter